MEDLKTYYLRKNWNSIHTSSKHILCENNDYVFYTPWVTKSERDLPFNSPDTRVNLRKPDHYPYLFRKPKMPVEEPLGTTFDHRPTQKPGTPVVCHLSPFAWEYTKFFKQKRPKFTERSTPLCDNDSLMSLLLLV